MGANAVNTMCERLAPELEKITGGQARLRIISNLAIYRLARAKATWKTGDLAESMKEHGLSGSDMAERILDAYEFAANDVFRAATHNKGIMNGIDAVAIATGQDFRALEAGAHAYASYKNKVYGPLTHYRKNRNGDIEGQIELPLAVGLVGGAVKTHPLAQVNLKLLKVSSAQQLAMVMASVGLAQNFAAMRALATEGIQKGHMRLHARNIAVTGGAKGSQIESVATQMVAEKKVSATRAREIVDGLGHKPRPE
jgi:hydroxymethylglutaryl-CoA reductase